jgi:DNA-binding CsgD family transcriptional regulator
LDSDSETFSADEISIDSTISDIPLYKIKSFLHQKYVVEGLSPQQISDQIFSARSSVLKYLKAYKIPLRPADTAREIRRSPAFGQRRLGGFNTENKTELEVIKKMRKLRAEGLSYWKIADVLNALGVPTKTRKGRWSAKQVHQIMMRLKPDDLHGEDESKDSSMN